MTLGFEAQGFQGLFPWTRRFAKQENVPFPSPSARPSRIHQLAFHCQSTAKVPQHTPLTHPVSSQPALPPNAGPPSFLKRAAPEVRVALSDGLDTESWSGRWVLCRGRGVEGPACFFPGRG